MAGRTMVRSRFEGMALAGPGGAPTWRESPRGALRYGVVRKDQILAPLLAGGVPAELHDSGAVRMSGEPEAYETGAEAGSREEAAA